MAESKVGIKVIFDGVAQSAMSATRRLLGEIKQLGAESKRASAVMAGIGKGMMKGLEGGAMFGAGAMVGYNQFVVPMLKAAETYEEAVTRATVAFMNAQGKTSENFSKLVALSEKLSVDYAGSASCGLASNLSLLHYAAGRPISSAAISGSRLSSASGIGGRALSFIGRLNPFLMAASTGVTAYNELMREGVTAEDVKNMQVRAASEAGGRGYVPTELQINYQPTVTIQTAEARETEKFLKMLNEHKDHMAKLVSQVQTRQQTIAFAR